MAAYETNVFCFVCQVSFRACVPVEGLLPPSRDAVFSVECPTCGKPAIFNVPAGTQVSDCDDSVPVGRKEL